MAYRNLQHFVEALEKAGELVRIKEYVDPHLEITEVYDRIIKKGGPALLFENTGTDFPLLINAMGSYKRMCKVFGVNELDDIALEIENLFSQLMEPKNNILDKLKVLPKLRKISSWMPKIISGKGVCQEVIMDEPDITKLPVLTCWPEDGGPFLTLPIVHTMNPNTGIRNVGLYRMQVFGPTLTAMHWHKHKVSASHFYEYKKMNKRMPVAVALGGDPVYTYSATAPMPENVDEYMLAGFLRKKRVELVKCLTQDIYVPADADIIIEGYIDPDEDYILEGPFGDHTGYYSLADYYPKFHITSITHKKDAIYPATAVGIPPQEDAYIGKATEKIFLTPLKMMVVPEIKDMDLPVEGTFHNLAIVSIKKVYPGQVQKVMNAMWGAGQMMFNKILIIVDDDVDIHNYKELARHISENVNLQSDIYFSQGPLDVLDHSCSKMTFGSKMCIDGTRKLQEELSRNGNAQKDVLKIKLNKEALKKKFTEIIAINDDLLQFGISIVFISVRKNRKNHIRELSEMLFSNASFKEIKTLIYLEDSVDINHLGDIVWKATNNIDPKRDSFIIAAKDDNGISHIGFDGTRKTKELDAFSRDWPNIIVSNEKTIEKVDKKWDKLRIGKLITSPSLRYRKQLYGGGAVVKE